MNILGLFLNDQIRTGGHRRYLDLMERLAARGNQVTVILNTSFEFEPSHFRPLPVSVPYTYHGPYPASLLFRRAVLGRIDAIRAQAGAVDVIAVFGETHLPVAASLSRRLGASLLYAHRNNTVREDLISVRENAARPLMVAGILWDLAKARRYEGMIARVADVIVFQSSYDLEDFVSREPDARPRCRVVRGDIRVPRFRPEHADTNRSSSMRRMLFVGTLGERKGVKYVLRAVERLAKSGVRDVCLDVVGPGDQRSEWEAYVRSAGIADMVRFHGRIADPFPMMVAADLLIVPSLFDSYPNVVLEALHVGTPVIGSWVGGIPDMLRHPELLFPPADAEAIADRLAALHDDPRAYERVRALCRSRRGHFDFDWAGEFEKIMREAVARREYERRRRETGTR